MRELQINKEKLEVLNGMFKIKHTDNKIYNLTSFFVACDIPSINQIIKGLKANGYITSKGKRDWLIDFEKFNTDTLLYNVKQEYAKLRKETKKGEKGKESLIVDKYELKELSEIIVSTIDSLSKQVAENNRLLQSLNAAVFTTGWERENHQEILKKVTKLYNDLI